MEQRPNRSAAADGRPRRGRRFQSASAVVVGVFLAASVSSCGTVQSLLTYPEPFGGTGVVISRDSAGDGAVVVILLVDLCLSAVADVLLLPVTVPLEACSGETAGEPLMRVDLGRPPLSTRVYVSADSAQVCAGWLTYEDSVEFACGHVVGVSGEPLKAEADRLPPELLQRFPDLRRALVAYRLKRRFYRERIDRGEESERLKPSVYPLDDRRALVLRPTEDEEKSLAELWVVEEALRKVWESPVLIDRRRYFRAEVTLFFSSATERILVAAPPGPFLVLDPEDGSIEGQFPLHEHFGPTPKFGFRWHPFVVDPEQDLLVRGDTNRGVVQLVRLSHPKESLGRLEVPWGLQGLWYVYSLRLVAGQWLVVDFHAPMASHYATVVYSLADSRVVWSETQRSIGAVVLSPDGKSVAYLRDRDVLEIAPLESGS